MAEVAAGDGAMAFKLFGTTIRVERPVAKEAEEPKESCGKEGEMMAAEGLVCPRCKSTDTKFCYFNNYNVNQPRHFCRACHRYWTAGGALRDVPIGAGRRRSRPLPRPAAGYPVPCMSTMVMGYWLQDPPAKRPCSGFSSRFSC